MPLDPTLLDVLRCPENRGKLHAADRDLVEALNRAIDKRALRDRRGVAVEERLDDALVRDDEKFAYPVRDGIPELLVDEAIPLEQLPRR